MNDDQFEALITWIRRFDAREEKTAATIRTLSSLVTVLTVIAVVSVIVGACSGVLFLAN